MRINRFSAVGALAAAILCLAPHRAAAGEFDGRWVADIPAQGRCNGNSLMTMIVSGGDVSGQVQNPGGVGHFTGQIDANGMGTFVVERRDTGTLRFKGDRFEASWNNRTCDRHAAGSRDLDDAGRAAVAAQRKQHQAAYADLLQKAQAGDRAVDYSALRAESVFATDWAYYNGKATALLKQADAAVKGKDCAQAMDTLDQVIRLDFTIDSAHALKAQCLKAQGQGERARIEDDIAKGLVHSLMDSGKGDSEQRAYVVHTYSEEMDVLANRHIQIRTRQTQVRGSDGRLFEVVHGVSIVDGVGVEAQPHDIWFDMTSFVTGHVSRRAAAQVLQAQLR
jgi:hypothetical protein